MIRRPIFVSGLSVHYFCLFCEWNCCIPHASLGMFARTSLDWLDERSMFCHGIALT